MHWSEAPARFAVKENFLLDRGNESFRFLLLVLLGLFPVIAVAGGFEFELVLVQNTARGKDSIVYGVLFSFQKHLAAVGAANHLEDRCLADRAPVSPIQKYAAEGPALGGATALRIYAAPDAGDRALEAVDPHWREPFILARPGMRSCRFRQHFEKALGVEADALCDPLELF
ncbi:hypothetical protein NKY41_23630 [Sinorhizobium meliloti]